MPVGEALRLSARNSEDPGNAKGQLSPLEDSLYKLMDNMVSNQEFKEKIE